MIRSCAVASLCLASLVAGCSSTASAPIACASPSTICQATTGPFCSNLATDVSNCGRCGDVCAVPGNGGSTSCIAGQCAPTCGGGSKALCNASGSPDGGQPVLSCTDTATDVDNCGGCGNVCPPSHVCTAGACVASTLTACGGATGGETFKDLQNDHENCGLCGNACGSTEVCSTGRCGACPIAQCGNVCTDTQSDNANCGVCGNVVNICENGRAFTVSGASKIALELQAPASTGFLPNAGTTATQVVKVHAQLRVQSVTLQIDSQTPLQMSQISPAGVTPSLWSVSFLVPQQGTTQLTFVAADEAWLPTRTDAAEHTVQVKTPQLSILPPPSAAPTALTATLANASLAGRWVPLNGGNITFTAMAGVANIASLQFFNNQVLIGTANPGQPLVLSPAKVGAGAASITACALDVVGQAGPCSAAVTFTVGAIPVAASAPGSGPAQPVLGKAADGSRTIFFFGAAGNMLVQPYDQPSDTPATPGTGLGSGQFLLNVLQPTAESTGVYAIPTNGQSVWRFDCGKPAGCVTQNFVVAPSAVAFNNLLTATSQAMLLTDANGDGFFAQALAGQTSDTAVPGGGAPQPYSTTQSGAIVAWANAKAGSALYLFHPAITSPANHLFPILTQRANTNSPQLTVFADGTIVFQYQDAITGQVSLGAAFFDGTHPPVVLAPFPIGPANGAGGFGTSFIEAKPGVVLGLVPPTTATAGGAYQPVELSLTLSAQQQFSPAPFVVGQQPGPGPLCQGCIEDRYGRNDNFTVSDDGTKALFVTQDTDTGPLRTLRLLDLASGIAASIGSSSLLSTNLQRLPRFVHTAASYSGGAPVGFVPAVVWAEQLNQASGSVFIDERLSFVTWSATGPNPAVTVDRDAGYFNSGGGYLADSVAESATAHEMFFLAQRAGGGADLYSVDLTGSSGAAKKVADRVFWYAIREDTARILVARADGTLLYSALKPGVDLTTTLTPILTGGPTGDSLDYFTDTESFGFTPDGNHAYAAVSQSFSNRFRYSQGIVVTIDLTSGARVDFGNTVWNPPQFGALFLDNAKVAYLADNFEVQDYPARFVYAQATTGTLHRDTNAFPNGFVTTGNDFLYYLSPDLTEALVDVGGCSRCAARAGGSAVGVAQEDGTFLSLGNFLSTGLFQINELFPPALGGVLRFGAPQSLSPFLLDWVILLDNTGGSFMKVFGGGLSPAPLIPITTTFSPSDNSTATRQTPDHKELLYSFTGGNVANTSYVMDLPISGRAPFVPPAP